MEEMEEQEFLRFLRSGLDFLQRSFDEKWSTIENIFQDSSKFEPEVVQETLVVIRATSQGVLKSLAEAKELNIADPTADELATFTRTIKAYLTAVGFFDSLQARLLDKISD